MIKNVILNQKKGQILELINFEKRDIITQWISLSEVSILTEEESVNQNFMPSETPVRINVLKIHFQWHKT